MILYNGNPWWYFVILLLGLGISILQYLLFSHMYIKFIFGPISVETI